VRNKESTERPIAEARAWPRLDVHHGRGWSRAELYNFGDRIQVKARGDNEMMLDGRGKMCLQLGSRSADFGRC
jgi:hypothetical protein